jgi:parallel beta-helix repeat protein
MTSTLGLKSGLSVTGLNGARLIQKCPGNLIFGTAVTNCQISNLELAGSGTNVPANGIYLVTNCKSNQLTNLYVHDFDGNGILLGTSNTQYNVIVGNCVSNCMGGAGIGLGYTAGDSIIESNRVYRTRFHGIIVSTGGSRCLIGYNTIVDAGYYIDIASNDFAHGIGVDGGGGAVNGSGNVIIGNIISNSAMAGIEVADWQNNCTIVQNQIFGTGNYYYGIYFGGGLAPSTNVTIISNYVQNAVGNGIQIDSPGNGQNGISSDAVIRGNTVRNSNNDGIHVGLAANVFVTGNTCQNNGRYPFSGGDGGDGIHVEGRGPSSRYIVVFGNQCFDSGSPTVQRYGIFVNVVSNAWICANTLGSNTLTPEKVGPLYIGTLNTAVTVTP